DALRIVQRLKFAGVRVIYISQGIDSDSEQHETLIAVHGLVDGLYLREMSAKIKRGLKGQLERGFTTGSKTYGYRSIGIPDPNRHGEMIGYRLEIEPSEAKVIREIFAWYIAGATMPSILARLVGQGYPSPRGGRWRIGAVRRILRNEKYRGLLIWGQRAATRKPGSRTKAVRATPRDQWHVLERPELRIITDELWTQAQARRCETDAVVNRHRQRDRTLMRGRSAQLHSTTLFSGFMTCGECGHVVTVVANRLHKGRRYRYYGCAQASRNGAVVCTNRTCVRVEAADRALLDGLQTELTRPETIDYISAQLTPAVHDIPHQRPAPRADLERTREIAQAKLRNLIAAIEAGATSPTVLAALNARE